MTCWDLRRLVFSRDAHRHSWHAVVVPPLLFDISYIPLSIFGSPDHHNLYTVFLSRTCNLLDTFDQLTLLPVQTCPALANLLADFHDGSSRFRSQHLRPGHLALRRPQRCYRKGCPGKSRTRPGKPRRHRRAEPSRGESRSS